MFYNNENGSQCSCVLKLCLILLVVLKLSNASFLLGRELPCHFYDSINITDGVHHANQSITFHGIEYPPEQYVEVNYILINGARPVKVTPYIRGCLCSIRACVRLCCPYGSFVTKINTENGIKCRESESVKPIESEIITGYNETSIVNLDKHFAYIDRICNLHSVANDDLKIHKVSIVTLIQNRSRNLIHFVYFRMDLFRISLVRTNIMDIVSRCLLINQIYSL